MAKYFEMVKVKVDSDVSWTFQPYAAIESENIYYIRGVEAEPRTMRLSMPERSKVTVYASCELPPVAVEWTFDKYPFIPMSMHLDVGSASLKRKELIHRMYKHYCIGADCYKFPISFPITNVPTGKYNTALREFILDNLTVEVPDSKKMVHLSAYREGAVYTYMGLMLSLLESGYSEDLMQQAVYKELQQDVYNAIQLESKDEELQQEIYKALQQDDGEQEIYKALRQDDGEHDLTDSTWQQEIQDLTDLDEATQLEMLLATFQQPTYA